MGGTMQFISQMGLGMCQGSNLNNATARGLYVSNIISRKNLLTISARLVKMKDLTKL